MSIAFLKKGGDNLNLPKILNYDLSYYNRVSKMNKKIEKYGLLLTQKDVAVIIEEREHALIENRRVELDIQVTEQIIEELSSSPFVDKDNFVESIIEMQEIFYYIKSETDDRINDEELLEVLFECYREKCRGSLELLSGRETDLIIRQINLL